EAQILVEIASQFSSQQLRQDHAAVASLTGPHARARRALELADRRTSLGKGRLDPPDSDLLAAADDRVRRRKLEVGPGRRIEPPQRLLETPMTAERAKRRGDGARHRGIGVPELGGGRMADNGALR